MADKGETKSYKRQSFNTTEGGLFCGYVQENNAKFAVALRRILPSPNNFKTDHYIALQMNGEYDGAIQMNAPRSDVIFQSARLYKGNGRIAYQRSVSQKLAFVLDVR